MRMRLPRQSMKALCGLIGLAAAIVTLGFAGVSCTSGESRPPVTPSPSSGRYSATPSPVAHSADGCPVAGNACDATTELLVLLKEGHPELVNHVLLSDFECPGPQATGLGGPWPLCDGAPSGEVRRGFKLTFYAEPVTVSAERLRTFYLDRLSDAGTQDTDWSVRSIACEETREACDASFLLTFGLVAADGQLASLSAALLFEVRLDAGATWMITRAMLPYLSPELASPFLFGGAPGADTGFFTRGFGEFLPWQP